MLHVSFCGNALLSVDISLLKQMPVPGLGVAITCSHLFPRYWENFKQMCLQGLTGAIIKSKLLSSDVYLAALLQTCSEFVQDIAVSQLLIYRINTFACNETGAPSESFL